MPTSKLKPMSGLMMRAGSLRAAHFDTAFFLNRGSVEDLIGMRSSC